MTDESKETLINPVSDNVLLMIVALYALAFLIFGLLIETPATILQGLIKIITNKDAILTDYFAVGGLGAAFVNAGLLTLSAALVYYFSRAKISGAAVASLFMVMGFGLCGKNILNVWFIVIGVFLYSAVVKETFAKHINIAFFGGALAPIFSEILFSSTLAFEIRLPLSVITSVLIGFILVPVAGQLFKAHMGFNLYNMGFTAGIVGILIVALFKSYGFIPNAAMAWTTDNQRFLLIMMASLLASMIFIGLCLDRSAMVHLKVLMNQTGRAPQDFIAQFGVGSTFINMGLSGTAGLIYILIIGGDLNGAVIGAIFSIIGFGAFGKHPKNIIPIMFGVYLGALAKPWDASDPTIQLVALFGTTLAPIAGHFGWRWGVVAGFMHSSAALSVGALHVGLNLYNNGFAAGLVAAVLTPVIMVFQSNKRVEQ